AGPNAGIAGACAPGSRTGRADLNDGIQTSDKLTIAVRTPSDYDPTRAYPLLIVYPPAGRSRRRSENFYDLTTEATRRGFIVAFSDPRGSSASAMMQQAKVASTVAGFFCVDEKAISYLGHSDGGTMAETVPANGANAGTPAHSIAASGAGITGADLAGIGCPAIPSVLIIHSKNDERFPGYGRGTAAYWARCGGCSPMNLDDAADGCHQFKGCKEGRRVTYCQTSLPHDQWPPLNKYILDFIQKSDTDSP
ncbi:MAG: hypothetical protein J2P49_07305, partial [Methylocapsa sp.]|nr:hypothetical protein [Methylocapsa sp.]